MNMQLSIKRIDYILFAGTNALFFQQKTTKYKFVNITNIGLVAKGLLMGLGILGSKQVTNLLQLIVITRFNLSNQEIMSIRTFQKFQPSAKRGLSKCCEICQKAFSVLNAEHQCKRCLRPICKECGKTKRDVYKIGMIKNPHRLCQICSKESDYIRQYISNNELKFGEDSLIGRKWMNKIPDNDEDGDDKNREEREREETQFYQVKFTYQMFCEVWDAYNYSLREFVGILTFQKNQKQIYKQVNYVYKSLVENGFVEKLQTIIFLIIFFLCFLSQQSCLTILEHILPLASTISEPKLLLNSYLKALKAEESELKKISEYTATKLKTFISSFSVNVVTVECSIHLINRILDKQKIEQAYILFAIVLDENVKNIVSSRDKKVECDLELVKNCRLDKFMDKYRLASTAKVAHLLKPLKTPQQKLLSNSPTRAAQDNISNKTRSIRDESSLKELISTNEQHKTQKPLQLPKISEYSKYTNEYSSDGQCFQCEKYRKKIQDLQSKLKLKEKDIQDLNFMVNFKKQDSWKNKASSQRSIESRQMMENSQSSLFIQLSQQKRENASLKSQLLQLQQSNKILKNALSSSQPFSHSSPSPSSSSTSSMNHQQSLILLQTLKQKLQTKSKQYQEVIKKNKLLNYQIEEMQRQYAIKKPETNVGTREELTKKLEELSIRVNEEQEEKIKIANQLFQAKEIVKLLGGCIGQPEQGGDGERISYVREETQLVGVKNYGRQQCSIF